MHGNPPLISCQVKRREIEVPLLRCCWVAVAEEKRGGGNIVHTNWRKKWEAFAMSEAPSLVQLPWTTSCVSTSGHQRIASSPANGDKFLSSALVPDSCLLPTLCRGVPWIFQLAYVLCYGIAWLGPLCLYTGSDGLLCLLSLEALFCMNFSLKVCDFCTYIGLSIYMWQTA